MQIVAILICYRIRKSGTVKYLIEIQLFIDLKSDQSFIASQDCWLLKECQSEALRVSSFFAQIQYPCQPVFLLLSVSQHCRNQCSP